MLRRIMPSPAMAVALMALFVALGSGAYAQVSANSVGTAQLRNGAVTHPKLAHNSVWHANIGRHSVRNNNLAHNSVWHAQLGGGVVRRNNVFAPLLAELGPARTTFAQGVAQRQITPNQNTPIEFNGSGGVSINTSASEHTLTALADGQLENDGTGQANILCEMSVTDHSRKFAKLVTVGMSHPSGRWASDMTILGQWPIGEGRHTVTISCTRSQQTSGTIIAFASASVLLAAR